MRPELPRARRTYTVEDARQARKDLRVRLLAIEERMTALERARHTKARGALKGGLSFPSAVGGELGLCETAAPAPVKRTPWWKRESFTIPMTLLWIVTPSIVFVLIRAL